MIFNNLQLTILKKNLIKLVVAFLKQNQRPLIVILGPTASGKTALSIELAEKFNGEVISADSRQIYKSLDIGTAKITKKEMQGIKHHLLDVVKPDEYFSVVDFQKRVYALLPKIWVKQRVPFLVGGTGLYIDAVVDGFTVPEGGPDWELREKLEKEATEELYARLQNLDPVYAATINHGARRFIIRALEIIKATGKKRSQLMMKKKPDFKVLLLGLNWPREELYARINQRVGVQFEQGLMREVEKVLKKGYLPNCPALSGIGYKEVIKYLEGKLTLPECVKLLKKHNRNYAKRQMTWFRRRKDIHWLDYG